jgi:hypothetical protein
VLLCLQLLRIVLGPASLTNLATAGLCVLATNNGAWIPAVAKAAAWLGWDSGHTGAAAGAAAADAEEPAKLSDELFAILDSQPPPKRTGSNCSITSMFMFEGARPRGAGGRVVACSLQQRSHCTPCASRGHSLTRVNAPACLAACVTSSHLHR